jgi:hypothetical protein
MAAGDPVPELAVEKRPSPVEAATAAEAEETRPPPAEAPGSLAEEKPPDPEAATDVDTRPPQEAPGPPPGFPTYAEKEIESEANGTKEMEAGDKVDKEKKGKAEAKVVEVAEVKVEGKEKAVGPTQRPAGSGVETPILAVPMVAVPCFIAPAGFPVRFLFLYLSLLFGLRCCGCEYLSLWFITFPN